MSLRADGIYYCDRCGAGVGNARVQLCAVIVDMDPTRPGQHRQLHLCRVNDCAGTVLDGEALADWQAVNA